MALPGFDLSTWRHLDIQDTVLPHQKTISQNGTAAYTLTFAEKSKFKSYVSAKETITLHAAVPGAAPAPLPPPEALLGSVHFADHVFSKNDIAITLAAPCGAFAAAGEVTLARDGSLKSTHSFALGNGQAFTWRRAKEYGGQKLGKGSLVLCAAGRGDDVAVFQAVSRGGAAGRLFVATGLPQELVPVVLLTAFGMCAKEARDSKDEKLFTGIFEGGAELAAEAAL